MIWFLYGLALFWIAVGTLFILYTEESRRFLRNFIGGMNPRAMAFIPMVVGILLIISAKANGIISAKASGAFWFILILGLLAIGKGVYFLLAPSSQTKSFLTWWFDSAQDRTYRLWGLIIVVLGMVILSWV
jgi:uncharacterized protein YjeT (DUF2065 family)